MISNLIIFTYMKKIVVIFAISFHCVLFGQSIVSYKDCGGILFEQFNTLDKASAYSYDNEIYSIGRTFTFSYSFTKDSLTQLFVYDGDTRVWELVDTGVASDNAVRTFTLSVINDLFPKKIYDYVVSLGQSVSEYAFYDNNSQRLPIQENPGLVENPKNIWMHPPRAMLFRILELNPFPYVKYPIKKGSKWGWKLTIGNQWGDSRWVEWDKAIVNRYKYCIVETNHSLLTPMGQLDCAVIKATANNRVGKTSALFYFNKKYGFLRLDYLNIDGSTISIELTNVSDICTP